MEMFDELVETKISGDGKVTAKRYVTDEETLAEVEFAEACDEYVRAARKFEKLDRIAKAQKGRRVGLRSSTTSLQLVQKAPSTFKTPDRP